MFIFQGIVSGDDWSAAEFVDDRGWGKNGTPIRLNAASLRTRILNLRKYGESTAQEATALAALEAST